MSGSSTSSTAGTNDGAQRHGGQNWAALAKHNERLVDASHPLLADLRRDHPEIDRTLQAAS